MRLFLFFTTFFTVVSSFAQNVNFDQYEILQAQAPVPDIVTRLLSDVYEDKKDDQIEGVGYSKSQEYFQESNFQLKQILNSGLILFNDPITNYVEKVGRKIISKDEDLQNIQFFTVRTNVVNAFVTPQGTVFITQGLIAQLENEAQLAYILAHEIAHYKLNHNVIKFRERVEIMNSHDSHSRRIKKLSNYSKDKEFSADSLGIHYYNQANYSKNELYKVFDVLSYSYLPFELREMPKDYFNSEKLYIPEELFVDEYPEISVDEDYDDSKSSHPNIESRREKLSAWVDEVDRWGSDVYKLTEEEFLNVRKIARFESVSNDLFDVRPENALYSILILESDHPNNEYLTISKAKAWSQLISLRNSGKFFRQISDDDEVQGEHHRMVHFLREIDREALYTIALRAIHDAKESFPNNEEMEALYNFSLKELARTREFDIDAYKNITYHEGFSNFQNKRDSLIRLDSLKAAGVQNDSTIKEESLSKYDKIRSQNDTEEVISVKDSFDIEKFYVYGLSDVIDSTFRKKYAEIEEKVEKENEEKEYYENLSSHERRKLDKEYQKNGMKREVDNIVMLNPSVIFKDNTGDMKMEKSTKVEEFVGENLVERSIQDRIDVNMLNSHNNSISQIEVIQDQNLVINALRQISYFDDVNLFPVQRDELVDFKNKYGSAHVGLFLAENYKRPIFDITMFFSVYIPPLFLLQLTSNIMKHNAVDYTFVLINLDTEDFEVEAAHTTTLHGSRSKRTVASMLNYYLNELPQVYED